MINIYYVWLFYSVNYVKSVIQEIYHKTQKTSSNHSTRITYKVPGVVVIRDRMVNWFTTMHSVSITTKVVSLNPTHGKVYSIQHYVIKFVSGTPVSSTNKTDRPGITKILLKVALNNITPFAIRWISQNKHFPCHFIQY